MGLDMYLRGEKFFWTDWRDDTKKRREDDLRITRLEIELGYWRKHPNLHGFIVQAFANGVDECQRIELERNNLFAIVSAIKAKALPETIGFFFGESYGTDEEKAEDLAILEKAIAWLDTKEERASRSVFYRASW